MTLGREMSRRLLRLRVGAPAGVALAACLASIQATATPASAAPPSAPYTQCPAIGADTSCETLIVINANGSVTIVSDAGQGPYDGGEDTLIGVLNNEPVPVSHIKLTSPSLGIFGFEGDGICSAPYNTFAGSGYCSSLPSGSSRYEGPDTTFSAIAANKRSGTVNFTDSGGGLPAGSSTFFSLEQNILAANLSATAPPLITFINTSPTSADVNDPTTVSATLTANGSPVVGATVTFKIESGPGGTTCTGVTNGSGVASCSLTPSEAPGGYQISASFAGDANNDPSSRREPFTVTHEEAVLTYTGPTTATNGKPLTLSGTLTTDDPAAGTGISGETVTLTIGSGASAQSCTGTTGPTGAVSCTIPLVSQSAGSVPISAAYAGNGTYRSATAAATLAVSNVVPTPGVGASSGLLRGLAMLGGGALLAALAARRRRRERGST